MKQFKGLTPSDYQIFYKNNCVIVGAMYCQINKNYCQCVKKDTDKSSGKV